MKHQRLIGLLLAVLLMLQICPVASVDDQGVVTADSAGTVTISATAYNGIVGTLRTPLTVTGTGGVLQYALTADSVGYYFFRYLCETYGEGVSARITANLAALTEYSNRANDESCAVQFRQCVEAATEPGVFQNFVRDVIEK